MPEKCYAFQIKFNQCIMIQNPEYLQEARMDCMDPLTPMIWTVKSPQPPITDKIMVLGGWTPAPTEILDLGCKNFECPKTLPTRTNLDFQIAGMIGDTPFICGGEISGIRDIYGSCVKLENNELIRVDGYTALGMGITRAARGNVVLNGRLLSSGGYQAGPGFDKGGTTNIDFISAQSNTFIISFDGITKLDMESPAHTDHCLIKINETTILSTGGAILNSYESIHQTWWQNVEALETTNGPTMNQDRSGHGCATMKFNGKTILMVVGGKNAGKTSEYLDMDEMAWKFGPELPLAFEFPIAIASREQNTIFALSGVAEGKTRDEIYKLKCIGNSMSDCGWDKLDVKLKFARAGNIALPISDSLASELCN